MLIAALFAVLPAALYYMALFRNAVDIPNLDGYDALLGFLNHLIQLKSLSILLRPEVSRRASRPYD